MIAGTFVWSFALCALAVWRVAHLLAIENGPLNLVVRLRTALDSSMLGRLMDRFYFLSFLISLPPAIWMSNSLVGFFVQWLALSAVACLLERATQDPQMQRIRITRVSTSYIDKVIRGV